VDEFIPVRVPWAQHFSRWKKYNPFSGHWISFVRTLLGVRKKQFDWAISGRMDVRDNFLLWLSGRLGGSATGLAAEVFFDGPGRTGPVAPASRRHLAAFIGRASKPPKRDVGAFQLNEGELVAARSFLRERGISEDAF